MSEESTLPLHSLLDVPWDASRNMARDEALLDGSRAVLRRTAWLEPSVTIGRFQPWELVERAGALRAPIRRITGGGAILHGSDLTLALVAPCPSPLIPAGSPAEIAAYVAGALAHGVAAAYPDVRCRGGSVAERGQRAVLDCFDRRTPFDLVIGDDDEPRKVGGLALHRRSERVLVQASIVREGPLVDEAGDETVLAAIAEGLGASEVIAIEDLDDAEEERSWELRGSRYGTAAWNRRVRAATTPR